MFSCVTTTRPHKDTHSSSQPPLRNKKNKNKKNLCAWFCFFILTRGWLKGHCPRKTRFVWLVPFKSIFINIKNCTWETERSQSAWVEGRPCRWMTGSPPSSWPRRQSLSYLRSPSRCTYHLLRCRSSALRTTPLTVRGIKDVWKRKENPCVTDRCWTEGLIWLISPQYL